MPETKTHMCYVAEDPEQPGAAFAACIDMPGFAKETARDIAAWKRRGATIKHVDGDTMSAMMARWVPPVTKGKAKAPPKKTAGGGQSEPVAS